ncbi:MAG: sigma-70 family RNA polymerase sigma factor [Actinobacteria bacterium]|nr:MAG: sigma-70 family RNA polymerase sigma factor [Actinomycetota bacterium]
MGDLAGLRHRLHPGELHPLHVTHDCDPHYGILTPGPPPSFQDVDVTLPPFERFYEEHRDEIFGFLVRRLGRDRAEDAFQETFLRALRAYPRLRHGEHLRAWAYTIAGRIAIDEHRRPRADADLPELASLDGRPAFAQLEHLADELPPTERAAVVLRYGYDLDYAEIGAALGSNATAARQAASAGIRRLRRKEPQ